MKSPVAVALGAALVLTGCSASDSLDDLSTVTHVHNVVIHDGQVLAGTNEGLYAQQEDGRWLLLGEKFDVMGLTEVDGRLLVSGHPSPNFPFPDPLGLLESDNSGETWSSRGLTGEVDFHLLDASADTILGAAANLGALIRSEDGGTSWEPLTVNALTDFALNPLTRKKFSLPRLRDSSGLAMAAPRLTGFTQRRGSRSWIGLRAD